MRVRFAATSALVGTVALVLAGHARAAEVAPRFATTHLPPQGSWMAPLATSSPALLYISAEGCDCVNVYDQQTRRQIGSIGGVPSPTGITTGPDGTLWVAATNSVEAFPPGKTLPSLTIPIDPNKIPIDVAVKDDGTVDVAIFGYSSPAEILEYPKGATKPSRILSLKGVLDRAYGLTFDGSLDLYVTGGLGVDEGRIAKIAAGGWQAVVLSPILAYPGGIAFDASGNVVVCDFDNATTYVLRPNAAQPFRHIGEIRTSQPSFLAFDHSKKTLYVGNALRAEVDIYDASDGRLEAHLPAFGGYGSYIGVATSPRAAF